MMRPYALLLTLSMASATQCDEPKLAGRTLDEWSEIYVVATGNERIAAAEAIASLAVYSAGGPQDNFYFAELVKLLSDSNPTIRCSGIHGIQMFGERLAGADSGQTAAMNTLEPLLKDEAPTPRIAAARAMLTLDPRTISPLKILEAGLQDRQTAVRRLAVTALCDLGPRVNAARPALQAALLDNDSDVRRLAKKALANLEETIP